MKREQKIWRLNKYCRSHKCNQEGCRIHRECTASGGKFFEYLDGTEINKLYSKLFGTQITENLTGAVKEESEKSKTVTDILEEVKQEMCDGYCKYPTIVNDREDLFAEDGPCAECPLNKL
nr:MAG TPA: hypothetical protein [Caudoviricetes sp.]